MHTLSASMVTVRHLLVALAGSRRRKQCTKSSRQLEGQPFLTKLAGIAVAACWQSSRWQRVLQPNPPPQWVLQDCCIWAEPDQLYGLVYYVATDRLLQLVVWRSGRLCQQQQTLTISRAIS
jgi:hypothetical protein